MTHTTTTSPRLDRYTASLNADEMTAPQLRALLATFGLSPAKSMSKRHLLALAYQTQSTYEAELEAAEGRQ